MAESKDVDIELLKRAALALSEHFDSVQIFATRKTQDGTVNCRWGTGDWFARYGHCRLWCMRAESEEIAPSTRNDWD
jgi:hypothetical protein